MQMTAVTTEDTENQLKNVSFSVQRIQNHHKGIKQYRSLNITSSLISHPALS